VKYQKVNIFRTMSLFLILLFLGLMSASITHAENYTFVKQWGSSGNGDGQFYLLEDIAVDSSDIIYAADFGNSRIYKFDINGSLLTTWNSETFRGSSSQVLGIGVDSSDNVYVACSFGNIIVKFDSNGNYLMPVFNSTSSIYSPRDVAVDSSGNVYVVHWFNNIKKFDSSGNFLSEWGSIYGGNDSGYFRSPESVAVDSSGNVYVADTGNNRIQKLDSSGNFITYVGDKQSATTCSIGSGNGQFDNPRGVAVDSLGNIYVADSGNSRIQKFDSSGNFITKWSSDGIQGLDSRGSPTGVAVDSSGNVYVSTSDSIRKFTHLPVSNFTSNVTEGSSPLSVQFNDTSTGSPISWSWDFGDGNTSKDVQNPIYTYYKPGNYTVNLTVSNEYGSNSTNQTIQVNTFLPNPNGYSMKNFRGPEFSREEFYSTYNNNIQKYIPGFIPVTVDSGSNLDNRIDTFYEKHFRNTDLGGICFGMSATSVLLYNKEFKDLFGNGFNDKYLGDWIGYNDFYHGERPKNVSRWVRSYHPLQCDYACLVDEANYNGNKQRGYDKLYEELEKRLTRGQDDMVLRIAYEGKWFESDGAHAVVPYKFEKSSDGKSAKIYVYDCNAPGNQELYIEMDTSTHQIIGGNWPTITEMDMVTLKAITADPQIPIDIFDTDSPNADLLFISKNLEELGYKNGELVSGIPGAIPLITSMNGGSDSGINESYYVPDPSVKMELHGTGSGNAEISMMTESGLIIANVPVTSGSVDEFKVLDGGKGVMFTAGNGNKSSLDLQVGIESTDTIRQTHATFSGIEAGGQIDLSDDGGVFKVQNHGQPIICDLTISLQEGGLVSNITVRGINVEEDSTISGGPSEWTDLHNATVTISHDIESDGTIDSVEFITTGIVSILPVTNFTSNVTEGNAPLTVQFTDLSENATEWSWDFGDNNTSNEQNPAHTYAEAGTYTVNLSVSNPSGWDNITKTGYIIVNASNTPVENLDEVPYAYITAQNDYGENYGTVTVINTATNKVTATVPVGSYPVGVAVTPDRTKVYVANTDSDTVSVIDTATNTVISTVDVGSVPSGVAINPDGTKVYVTNYYSNTASVIDTDTDTVTATVPVGDGPSDAAVSPNGKNVYVANHDSNIISVIDTSTNTVAATVDIGSKPSDVAVTLDGKNVYVAESNNETVSVIDTSTNTVTAIVHVRSSPDGVTVSPDGKKVYVANSDSNTVYVIDSSTNTVTDSVDVGSIPVDIAITSDGKKVYVTNYESQEVSVIDTSTNTVTATVSVGRWLNNIAISQFPESPQTALPVANFTSNVTEGNVPLTVQFTDLSENATEWNWDFDNDGIIDSMEQNPSYTYPSAGTYTVNLTVSNAYGNDSEVKTDYIVVSTPETLDTTAPVIQSVVLFPANITAGSSINISVNVTDETDVTEVKVGGIIQLTKTDGIWQGIIETPSSNSVGNYPLQITANDAAGNIAETSVPYHVVKLTGGANIAVSPRSNSITAGNTASLSIKVKNTQNIDDTFKVRINVSELPASYRADFSWFNWTEKVVSLRTGEEVLIPMEVTVPDGTAAGRKLFRAKVNSEKSSITGFDTGYLVIS